MSSKTLSGRRKAGREAFDPNTNPMEVQPYRIGTWAYDMWFEDWLKGWKEAEKEYKDKIISHFEEVEEVSLTKYEKDTFFDKPIDYNGRCLNALIKCREYIINIDENINSANYDLLDEVETTIKKLKGGK